MTPEPADTNRQPSTPARALAPLAPAWGPGELASAGVAPSAVSQGQQAPPAGVAAGISAGFSAVARRLETSLGVSLRGQALILAIGASVVTVTLGQLQAFAVHENQRDARSLVVRLGPALAAARAEASAATAAATTAPIAGAAFDLRSLSALADAGLERLGDVHWVPTQDGAGGRLGSSDGEYGDGSVGGGSFADGGHAGWRLKRHGYLFALGSDGDGGFWLSAWPWEYGRSGREAYAWCSERGELVYPNRSGLLSGPEAVPEPQRAGWAPR